MDITIECPKCKTSLALSETIEKEVENQIRDELGKQIKDDVEREVEKELEFLRLEIQKRDEEVEEARELEFKVRKKKRDLEDKLKSADLEIA